MTTQLPPGHRWREVPVGCTGEVDPRLQFAVQYYDGQYHFGNPYLVFEPFSSLSAMIAEKDACDWTDDVLRQCLALPTNPTEPIPEKPVPVMTVEGVLREFFDERNFPVYGTTILDLCARLRAAFPQIDASPLTLDDHVDALVGMGAAKPNDIKSPYMVHGSVPDYFVYLPTPEGA